MRISVNCAHLYKSVYRDSSRLLVGKGMPRFRKSSVVTTCTITVPPAPIRYIYIYNHIYVWLYGYIYIYISSQNFWTRDPELYRMNRHVRSFNPDPSPPPQRSVQYPAIVIAITIPPQALLPSLAQCFGGVWPVGLVARYTCAHVPAEKSSDWRCVATQTSGSSPRWWGRVGGWTGLRPPRVSMVMYWAGGWGWGRWGVDEWCNDGTGGVEGFFGTKTATYIPGVSASVWRRFAADEVTWRSGWARWSRLFPGSRTYPNTPDGVPLLPRPSCCCHHTHTQTHTHKNRISNTRAHITHVYNTYMFYIHVVVCLLCRSRAPYYIRRGPDVDNSRLHYHWTRITNCTLFFSTSPNAGTLLRVQYIIGMLMFNVMCTLCVMKNDKSPSPCAAVYSV